MEEKKAFSKLEIKTLKDHVAAEIRRAIQEGILKPGDHISEIQLAKQMGVSRAPVREAINTLAKQGLIVQRPRKGAFIQKMNAKDMMHLYRIRGELEGFAAEMILEEGVKAELITALEDCLARMADAARKDDFVEFVAHDEAFHRVIYKSSGSKQLISILNSVAENARIFMMMTKLFSKELHKEVKAHRRIIDALRDNDRDNIVSIMKEHVYKQLESLKLKSQKEKTIEDDSDVDRYR